MLTRFYKNCCSFFLLLLLLYPFSQVAAQSTAPLSEGQWFKMGITREGVYKLSYQYLQQQGIISASTNPQFIRIYGQGGGMLPQANAAGRPDGLQENAIFVAGEADGRFDSQDYILFYGQGPDKIQYNPASLSFDYEKNLYSDTVYYFITVAAEKGLRMPAKENLSVAQPLIRQYRAYAAFEEEKTKILASSGRQWLGDQFGYTNTKTYQLPVYNMAPDAMLSVRSSFTGTSTSASSFKVYANEKLVHTVDMPSIADPRKNIYAEKGRVAEQETATSTTGLAQLQQLSVKVSFEGNASGGGGYLDYLFATANCHLQYRDEPLFFRSPESLQYPEVRFEIQAARQNLELWDISHPQRAERQQFSLSGNQLQFGAASSSLREYVLFNPAQAPQPPSLKRVALQNLRADLSPEMVIITHPSLLPEAERLADFRRQHDGLRVKVVSTHQVYNEFSSGAQDVTAIRDYMRHLYIKGGRLRYLLLFGRGYFDYKNRTKYNYNLVPVYQSYNSTHPVLSYSSDDYYGFLEEDEGSWDENEGGNHTLEIGIGRLPVVNLTEARQVVNKLIRYQSATDALGSWRNKIVFIADDGDNNVHHKDADRLADQVQENWAEGNINKIYLGAYPQIKSASGSSAPQVTEAINEAIERGALLINYTGHGSQDVLTSKRVITKAIIDKWKNKDRLPLVVTATCEFGQHDDEKRSGAEHMLLNPEGGAIGLLTASRPVYSHTNYEINSAFYQFAFSRDAEGKPQRLGDVIRQTKNRSVSRSGVINRNFLLLGDPSIRLSYPSKKVNISSLQFEADNREADTLGAYARVRATGSILDASGNTDTDFNGLLEAVVYEKPASYETIDPATPVMQFDIQNSLIFRGQASVEEGRFSFGFVIPKSIRYTVGQGKISLYAVDTSRFTDAGGEYKRFYIGGGSAPPTGDELPPGIALYLNDTTFRNGQRVGSKSMLMAHFQDESGINITNTGIQEGIVATLDGKTSFLLNDYYIAEPDDYSRGRLQFPLQSLSPGPHTLSITARDAYNNTGKSEIHFVVSDRQEFEIYSLLNHPNPFRHSTRIVLEHSRAGEDIETSLMIYKLDGRLVHQQQQVSMQSMRRIELPEWDGTAAGKKLPAGLYLFKIILRSLTDGSATERTEKLVILN